MSSRNNRDSKFKVLVYEGELQRVAGWVEKYPDLETGGDLFGFWTHSGFPVVQFVLGPGPKSRHNPTSFYQEKDYLIEAGSLLRSRHGLQHIGEWHSHHQLGLAQPSRGDEDTVFRALDRYGFPKFLLCIANLKPNSENVWKRNKWTVNIGSFLFTHSVSNYQVGQWVVLPGNSPIRPSLNLDRHQSISSFQDSHLSDNWNVEKTTLEAEILEPTQPVEITENLWYSRPEGLDLLRRIDADLKQEFEKCEMFREATGEIYFTFQQGSDDWRVELPNNFPHSSPIFQVNEEKPIRYREWSSQAKVIDALKSCFRIRDER